MPINSEAAYAYLQPGEVFFGGSPSRVRTILGSCVAITVWHPVHLVGGICHYMLPSRGRRGHKPLDGRYADEAIEMLERKASRFGIKIDECEFKLFGAGRMFSALGLYASTCAGQANGSLNVAASNQVVARAIAASFGARVVGQDLGGDGHRKVLFEVPSGRVWCRQFASEASPAVLMREGSP